MNKSIRYSLRVLAIAATLVLIVWVGVWVYISMNKEKLREQVVAKIKERTFADVQIGALEPSLLTTFPFVSVQVSDIIIKDTLWHIHKQNLFEAKKLFIRIDVFSLFGSQPRIGKVVVQNGTASLFIDSTGASNSYVFHSDRNSKNVNPYPDLLLKHVRLIYRRPSRNKLYDLKLQRLFCNTKTKEDEIIMKVNADIFSNEIAFNTEKGGFLKNKPVSGKFKLTVNRKTDILSFDNIELDIDDQPFFMTGKFMLAEDQKKFILSIRSRNALYAKTIQLIPQRVYEKLKLYDIANPINFLAVVDGEMKYLSKPKVVIKSNISNNAIKTPAGDFTNASLKVYFSNEIAKHLEHIDENSVIILTDVRANYETLPVTSRAIKIFNLKQPFLQCDVASDFDMTALNEITGTRTLQFMNGMGRLNLNFKGSLVGKDSSGSSINGFITIKDSDIKYLPRNFTLANCDATLRFRNKDLFVDQLKTSAGDTKLSMDGEVKDFLELLEKNPETLVLHWKIYSPHIYLKDFRTFLGSQATNQSAESKKAKLASASNKIDRMLTHGDVFLKISTPKLNYKRFVADNINADVQMTQNRIALRDVSMQHAKGSMHLSGALVDNGSSNGLSIKTSLKGMDIPSLFYAFNDFGQDAVTHRNLNGRISAQADITTALNDEGEVIPGSLNGAIDFLLENGELNNFEPFRKISETAFKKQDFSHIQFADLKNKLLVKGTSVFIERMEIRSTALVLFVEGVYDVKNGTDMFIKLPIRNLVKRNENIDLVEEDVRHGPSIRLRAKTGDDGKLKVSWDPFRRGKKAKKELEEVSGNK